MTHQQNLFATKVNRDNVVSDNSKLESQNETYSSIQNRNNRLDNLIVKILNQSVSHTEGIHPRIFCRRWFGLSVTHENGRPRFTEEQILAMESEHGYREKCINLIAKLLKIKPNTIHRWGKGVDFDKIPADKRQKYEIYLGYLDAIRVITMSLEELDEASLLKLLQKLEIRSIDRA